PVPAGGPPPEPALPGARQHVRVHRPSRLPAGDVADGAARAGPGDGPLGGRQRGDLSQRAGRAQPPPPLAVRGPPRRLRRAPGARRLHMKQTSVRLAQGDLVQLDLAGAAGWGPPLERDPALVARDVRAGYITVQAAREIYGVVVNPADWTGTRVVDS